MRSGFLRADRNISDAMRKDIAPNLLPQGGLALWVRFAEGIDVAALAAAGVAHGVGFTPGQAFASDGGVTNGARLGFGSLDEGELGEAVRRLGLALLREGSVASR